MKIKTFIIVSLSFFIFGCGGAERLKAEYEFNKSKPVFETKVTALKNKKQTLNKNAAIQLCELSGKDAAFDKKLEAAVALKTTSRTCRGGRTDSLNLPSSYGAQVAKIESSGTIRCSEKVDVPAQYAINAKISDELAYRQCLLEQGYATESICVKNCSNNVKTDIEGIWSYDAVCLIGPSGGTVKIESTSTNGVYYVKLQRALGLQATGFGKLSENYFTADLIWKINGTPLNLNLKIGDDKSQMSGSSIECASFNLKKKE